MDMKTTGLVSVVVLCYQNYSLLKRCVKSILEQDYPRIELIIADDASNYFNKSEIEAFIEENRRDNLICYSVLVNPVNLGTVKNISNAFKEVKGDYYITSGADDILADEHAITNYISGFCKFPDAVWICGNTIQVDLNSKKIVDRFPTEYDIPFFQKRNAKELWGIWARRGIVCSAAICYKKVVLDIVGGFDQNYVYIEDWPIFLKLLRNGYAPGYISELVCERSVGGISFSKDTSGKKAREKFLQEKYFLFETEVNPYIEEMSQKDRKKYKYYLSEIMDRTYFFDIKFAQAKSKKDKVKLMFESPRNFLWIAEKLYWKFYGKLGHKVLKKDTLYTILLLMVIFMQPATSNTNTNVTIFVGNIAALLSVILLGSCILIGTAKKIFKYRENKRNMVSHT